MNQSPKVTFGTQAWVDMAIEVANELFSSSERTDFRCSTCEVFSGAPAELSPDGIIAWHMIIDGQSVRAAFGEIDQPDFRLDAPYDQAAVQARTVYTPEYLADRAKNPEKYPFDATVTGGLQPEITPLMLELHNQMAVRTA